MLFNSYIFILAFLPLVLVGFFLLSRRNGRSSAVLFLTAASLLFYGWWNPKFLALILISIVVNFCIGRMIHLGRKTAWMWAGIIFNLGLLGYFKYAIFLADAVSQALGSNIPMPDIILPLAISFFTFQQITYLVDTKKGQVAPHRFLEYCLFVTFFPQLIAGPIVHHKEMMPQFSNPERFQFSWDNLSQGTSIFAVGLFKKVIIADTMARFATPVFTAAETGVPIGLIDGWGAALAYTFQLYFDFSGYSDMAIGLALMFGIRLPVNFFSPYKATSIIDFWRRWHMTLSRFLRDYLYIPLGGNRRGSARRHVNLMITMILGGLWHGAGWTFLAWGALHGLYLMTNNLWHRLMKNAGLSSRQFFGGTWGAQLLTFLAVVVGWVVFRADSLNGAANVLAGMAGLHGNGIPPVLAEIKWAEAYRWIVMLLAIVWLAPNTAQIFASNTQPPSAVLEEKTHAWLRIKWRATRGWAYLLALVFVASLANMTEISEFLYFRF